MQALVTVRNTLCDFSCASRIKRIVVFSKIKVMNGCLTDDLEKKFTRILRRPF